jgi:hypothetical protein
MEKEDFHGIIVICGLITFFISSFFFIGSEFTHQKLVEELPKSFLLDGEGFQY